MNLLCDQSAVLRTRSPLAYQRGMSRGSLRRALQLDLLVTVPVRVTVMLMLFLGCFMTGTASAETNAPKLDIGKGGECVRDAQWMRRNHMHVVKHQREETVRKGIREEKDALKTCVECHASLSDNSVVARDDSFCVGCHRYEAVRIDCFECHASKRKEALARKDGK